MSATRKLRFVNAGLSTALFLTLYANAFYYAGNADPDFADWLLCGYYLLYLAVSVAFCCRDRDYGKNYYVVMAVFVMLLPLILWIYVIADGFSSGAWIDFKRNWQLIAATVFAVAMAIVMTVGAVEQRYDRLYRK